MTEIDRQTFLKEKIGNFILHIKKVFGDNNILLREFADYLDIDKRGFDPFFKGLLEICQLLELPMNDENKKKNNMGKLALFLEMKGLKCAEPDLYKTLRYFELFYKTF